MNCESGEVNLSTLPPGACFELRLSATTALRGVLVRHGAGSVEVNIGESRNEHWCADAPVVYFAGANQSEWLIQTKEKNMAKNGKTKLRRVIYFEIGKKPPLERYLDEKNTAYSALMYRAIKRAKEPVTFAVIWDEIKRSVANKTEGKTPKATLSVILQKMVKDGIVSRSEAKEEAKAVAA